VIGHLHAASDGTVIKQSQQPLWASKAPPLMRVGGCKVFSHLGLSEPFHPRRPGLRARMEPLFRYRRGECRLRSASCDRDGARGGTTFAPVGLSRPARHDSRQAGDPRHSPGPRDVTKS
jgi:hypothetical protein